MRRRPHEDAGSKRAAKSATSRTLNPEALIADDSYLDPTSM